jgi:hypothetical protein
MAMIYADEGDLAEALKIVRRAYALGPWSPDTIGVLAGLTGAMGKKSNHLLRKRLVPARRLAMPVLMLFFTFSAAR